jgi:hypothetical protein
LEILIEFELFFDDEENDNAVALSPLCPRDLSVSSFHFGLSPIRFPAERLAVSRHRS